MKHGIRILSLLLVMMLALLAPAATLAETTADEDQTPVTISIMHNHSQEAAENIVSSAGFVAMLQKFKEDHPWVTLEENIVTDSFDDKYFALAAADELPDVCYVRYGWLANLAGNGLLADITDYVDPSMYVDNLYCMTYNGRIYGLPNKYSAFNLVLYNEDMWKEAGYDTFPQTLDELLEANEYFQSKGIDTIAFGNSGKWFATSYLTATFAYEFCGDDFVKSMIARDGQNKWTDERFVKALAAVQEMTPVFNKDCNMQDDIWAMGWYMQGNAAAHIVGNWGLDTARKMAEEYPDVWAHTRVALMPTVSGENRYISTAVGGNGIGVNSKLTGEKFDMALALCKQISSVDYAEFMAARGATAPIATTIDYSSLEQPYQDFAEIMNTYPSGLNITDYVDQSIATALHAAAQSLMAGDTTPEEAAQSIQMAQDMLDMQ